MCVNNKSVSFFRSCLLNISGRPISILPSDIREYNTPVSSFFSSSILKLLCLFSQCMLQLRYVRLFQITNLLHNSFILQQYVCYTTILNMFRAARCSSSGGQIVLLQPLVSSLHRQPYSMQVESGLQSALHLHTVRLFTEGDDTRGCSNTICPPEDEQGAARNMLRIVM